jgi:hypothetical protein
MTTTTARRFRRQKRDPMTDGLNKRGPKRRAVINPSKMVITTCRLPTGLLLLIDAETVRVSRETGVKTINRADLIRTLLEEAMGARAIAKGGR